MIKAKVIYDKAAMTGLMKFNAVDYAWKWIVYIVATVLSVASVFANFNTEYFYIAILFFIFIIAMDIFVLYSYFILPKVKLKSFESNGIIENVFEFTDNDVLIFSNRNGKLGKDKITYNRFFKVCESKTAFYLFLNKSGAIIVTKTSFVEGSCQDLRNLLNNKITGRRNKLYKK